MKKYFKMPRMYSFLMLPWYNKLALIPNKALSATIDNHLAKSYGKYFDTVVAIAVAMGLGSRNAEETIINGNRMVLSSSKQMSRWRL